MSARVLVSTPPRRASIVSARLRDLAAHIVDGAAVAAALQRRAGVRRRRATGGRPARSSPRWRRPGGLRRPGPVPGSGGCVRSRRSTFSGLPVRSASSRRRSMSARIGVDRTRHVFGEACRGASGRAAGAGRGLRSGGRRRAAMRSSISVTARSSTLTAVSVLRSVRVTRSVMRETASLSVFIASRVFSSMASTRSSTSFDIARERVRLDSSARSMRQVVSPTARSALVSNSSKREAASVMLGDAGFDAALGRGHLFLDLVDAAGDAGAGSSARRW